MAPAALSPARPPPRTAQAREAGAAPEAEADPGAPAEVAVVRGDGARRGRDVAAAAGAGRARRGPGGR